jgi:lipopolysaccharide exporter
MFLGLENIVKTLKTSAFIRNVFIVMSGTVLAQVLSFALSPVISRLFSPSDFGVFGSFSAILAVVAAGMTLQYSQALVLPKHREDAFGLFVLSCLSSLSITAICVLVCFVAPKLVLGSIKSQNAVILPLLTIGILSSGISQTFQGWCIRSKAFKETSVSQLIRSVSVNGGQIGLGYLKGGVLALVLTVVIGEMLATLYLARVVLRDIKDLWNTLRWRRLATLAKEYYDFPLYTASSNVINALSLGLPVFLLTYYYGLPVAGAYAFSARLIQAPMGLVLVAIRQVLYQKASETHNEGGRLFPLYLKITGGLFAVGFLPSLVLFIWSPDIFAWVFGNQWRTAGVFAQSLVIWLLFMFCNVPAVLFARIMRLQRRMFIYDQTILVGRAGALILGGLYLSASQTVLLFSLVGAVMNIIYIALIGSAVMKAEGEVLFRDLLSAGKKGLR